MEEKPVLIVDEYEIRPLIFTQENSIKFYEKAKQFPTIYGKEFLSSPESFMELFVNRIGDSFELNGLFWVINDFIGVFYLSEIEEHEGQLTDAQAHYTFFDRRHHGREKLIAEMLHFLFKKYGFNRLSVEIPNYASPQTRHFITDCGFKYEGKKRRAAKYKDDWFDVNLYGILKSELPELE